MNFWDWFWIFYFPLFILWEIFILAPPKTKLWARLKCSFRGHQWVPEVKTEVYAETNDAAVTNIKTTCYRCKESVEFTMTIRSEKMQSGYSISPRDIKNARDN